MSQNTTFVIESKQFASEDEKKKKSCITLLAALTVSLMVLSMVAQKGQQKATIQIQGINFYKEYDPITKYFSPALTSNT